MVAAAALIDGLPHVAIALVVVDRHYRAVDRYLLEVGSAEADELCIGIGEQASLQEWIVGKVDTANNVTGLELVGSVISSCGSV